MITLDASHYRKPRQMQAVAEAILAELRDSPPAPGYERVQVPGERERDLRADSEGRIDVPEQTWRELNQLAARVCPGQAV